MRGAGCQKAEDNRTIGQGDNETGRRSAHFLLGADDPRGLVRVGGDAFEAVVHAVVRDDLPFGERAGAVDEPGVLQRVVIDMRDERHALHESARGLLDLGAACRHRRLDLPRAEQNAPRKARTQSVERPAGSGGDGIRQHTGWRESKGRAIYERISGVCLVSKSVAGRFNM